jgi:hypothetical protein
LGVWVYTRVQTPRFCGHPCKAGLAVLSPRPSFERKGLNSLASIKAA